jgi:hypothetical protein
MTEQTPIDEGKRMGRTACQVDILFEAGLRTFDWSVERSRHFDIKASIILAFLGILLIPSLEVFSWSAKYLGLRISPDHTDIHRGHFLPLCYIADSPS